MNLNPVEARTVVVQAGGYSDPGCGARLDFKTSRYTNPPTLAQPRDPN